MSVEKTDIKDEAAKDEAAVREAAELVPQFGLKREDVFGAARRGPKPRVPKMDPEEAKKIIKDGSSLPAELAELTFEHRPLIWRDIADFAVRHQRTGADVVYDLALLSKYNYAQNVPKPLVTPIDLDLLVRLYDASPRSCAWRLATVRETFDFLYGPVIRQFKPGSIWTATDYKTAELVASRRFARLLGRADTATYRWDEAGGKVTRRLANILTKVMEICADAQVPHLRFEEIAVPVLTRRGIDIDKLIPLPTPATIRRSPGSLGRRVSVDGAAQRPTNPTYGGGAFI